MIYCCREMGKWKCLMKKWKVLYKKKMKDDNGQKYGELWNERKYYNGNLE
jgi:hypothetical protein